MDDSPVEHALHGDGLTSGHRIGVLPARPEIDQCPTAAVVDDELVAEYLGHAPLDGDRTSRLQRIDGGRLQQHDAPRLPLLGDSHPAGAGGSTAHEHGERRSCQQTSMPGLPPRRGRWVRIPV
ncbi:hypothetical protein [Bradyrhizobium macuxiense]|uniref:hypothetical protein n=1 Tax=Bradyrhizobium macuxiense TaxID=1755647 RepID=UPI00142EEC85|nr:hypothetical protein [Bradyrhizobium macuxiense]